MTVQPIKKDIRCTRLRSLLFLLRTYAESLTDPDGVIIDGLDLALDETDQLNGQLDEDH